MLGLAGGLGRPLCSCQEASSPGHAQAITGACMIQLKYAPWTSSLEQVSMARYNAKKPRLPTSRVQLRAKALIQVLAQTAGGAQGGRAQCMGQNCRRGASWHASGVSVFVLKHLDAWVAMRAGSRGPSFGANTINSEDEDNLAKSNVMWHVASEGALRCQNPGETWAVHPRLGCLGPLTCEGAVYLAR